MKIILMLSLLSLSTWATVTQQKAPTKEDLRKIALKQSRHWARQLSIQGLHSLSQKRSTGWGIKTLDSAYQTAVSSGKLQSGKGALFKANAETGGSLSPVPKQKAFTMMDMSNKLYEFLDRHNILVKAQADNASHIKYKLYQKKHLGSEFNVKISENKKSKSVTFSSSSPYIKKSVKLSDNKTLENQMIPFLNKTFKTWKRFRSRMLKEIDTPQKAVKSNVIDNVSPKEKKQEIGKPSLSVLSEEKEIFSKSLQNNETLPQLPKIEKTETKTKADNKAHFVDSLDNTGNPSRSLMEAGEIKASLEAALEDRLLIVEEDQDQWMVTLKDQNGGSSDRICTVKYEQIETGEKMVSMTNQDIDFLKHFEKFVSKSVTTGDKPAEMTEFFKDQLGDFVGIYVAVLGKQMSVKNMAEYIKDEIFAPKGITLQENAVSHGNSSEPMLMVMDSIDAERNQVITQVRIYKINKLYNQVQIDHREREIELQVPRQMDDVQKNQLKMEISEILSDDIINNTVGYKQALEILEDLLKSNLQCQKINVQDEGNNTTIVEVDVDSNCPFYDMSFVVTGFDYGYLQYMHLLLDNQYFQTEHLVAFTLEGDFKSNLEGVLTDMASNIQNVQKSSGQPSSGNLTLENLVDAIQNVVGTEVERVNLNEKEIVFKHNNSHGKAITVIRILVVPGDGETNDLFRVFLFDPSGHKKGFHHSKSQHEYMMYASNGEEELKIFTSDLTKWKAKLEKRKLEKI